MTEEAKQTILPKVEQEVSSPTIQSSTFPFTHKDFLQIQQAIKTNTKKIDLAALSGTQQIALLLTTMNEIIPGLYIGNYEAYRKISQSTEHRFSLAVKVTAQPHDDPDIPLFYAPLPPSSKCVLLDVGKNIGDAVGSWSLLNSRFPQAFSAMDEAFSKKQSILVFCSQGVSRSVGLATAYLVSRFQVTPEAAHSFIKTKRPQANTVFLPHIKQWALEHPETLPREDKESGIDKSSSRKSALLSIKAAALNITQGRWPGLFNSPHLSDTIASEPHSLSREAETSTQEMLQKSPP